MILFKRIKPRIEIPEVIRKIDIVLHLFAVNSLAKDGLNFREAFDMTNLLFEHDKPKINAIVNNDFARIVDKLMKDGYVSNLMGTNHEATYEGILMDHLGGYRQSYLNANRDVWLQKNQTAIQTGMFWLTLIVAVGTIVAALYYGTELYWKYGWFHFGKWPFCA